MKNAKRARMKENGKSLPLRWTVKLGRVPKSRNA